LKQNGIGLYIYDFKLNTFICLLPSIKSELTSQIFYNKLKKNWNLNKCGRLFNKSELPENYELKNMYSKNWNKLNLYRCEQINLQKKCKSCGKYFPGELLSIEIFCPECVKDSSVIDKVRFYIIRLKKSRSVPLDVFDIYDLERTYKDYGYERVCRICGNPLRKKDGTYSYHMCYCRKHIGHGYILYTKFNWGSCSKAYIEKVQFKNRKIIRKKLEEINIPKDLSRLVVICEECNELCQKTDLYYFSFNREYKDILKTLPIINVHHIIPVHTLDKSNIMLIWDFKNLICLCLKCHHNKHKSKKAEKIILISRQHKTLDQFI